MGIFDFFKSSNKNCIECGGLIINEKDKICSSCKSNKNNPRQDNSEENKGVKEVTDMITDIEESGEISDETLNTFIESTGHKSPTLSKEKFIDFLDKKDTEESLELKNKLESLDDGDPNVVKSYYENGNIKTEETFTNRGSNCRMVGYFENGKIEGEGTFKDGVEHGLFTTYHDNGNLHKEENYNHGKLDGIQKQYHKDGKIQFEVIYENDKQKSVKKYDEDGNEIEYDNKIYNLLKKQTEIMISEGRVKETEVKEYLNWLITSGEIPNELLEPNKRKFQDSIEKIIEEYNT